MAEEQFLLKDMFDAESVGALADGIADAWDGFDRTAFLTGVFDDVWPALELKQRMRRIATVLREVLPGGYRDQLQILLAAAAHTPATEIRPQTRISEAAARTSQPPLRSCFR